MSTLLKMIKNSEYWRSTFEKLRDKSTIQELDKEELQEEYEFNRDDIADRLWDGSYEWQIPRKVLIKKHGQSKHRVVYIYSIVDRLVLGMLYQVFSAYFNKLVQPRCYSYKKGLSTGNAIKAIKNELNQENTYGVKVDIHAYFNSISKNRVSEMIDELFINEEHKGIKKSIENLLKTDLCEYHGKIVREYKGVIPGTPIASFFANYCLAECDKYFDTSGAIYARYSDDIIIIEDNRESIDIDIGMLSRYLDNYGLQINPDKYKYFSPGDDITFLGIKLQADGTIDMSDHAKQKIKKQIHRWTKKGRKEIEMKGKDFMTLATQINRRFNYKNFKCYIEKEAQFGWCHYMFGHINTDKSLKELDIYVKDCLRAMKTGKHNKANYRALSEEDFINMGWISLVQLYHLYKKDFDYYCEIIDLI